MARKVSSPLNLTLVLLRSIQGWSQKELSEATGIAANLLSDYENGRKPLSRERLEPIAAALGFPSRMIDTTLRFLATAQASLEEPPGPAAQRVRMEAVAGQVAQLTSDYALRLFSLLTSESRVIAARERAAVLWERLKRLPPEQRRRQVETQPELRQWALAELLCEESVKAAADSADRALELASLALRVAELLPGEEPWRLRVQGYAWAHVGNARRVRGDLPSAGEAFDNAKRLWEAGDIGGSSLLRAARLPGMEASLRVAQRRLGEALSLLDQALADDPEGEESDRLLLNKARTLEFLGDHKGAISTLQGMYIDRQKGDKRLEWLQRFTLMVNLCHLGQHLEAESMLPELRAQTLNLGNTLDKVRIRWLEGRIAAGLGRREEAIAALSRVREEFASRGIAFDTGLAILELAVLYLEEGRTADVKMLARQMTPIFHAQDVPREAMAALKLFREAAEREAITVELARKYVLFFARSKYNPEIRFED